MLWALGWYLTTLALGALIWPIAARLFGRLPDRGYSVAKPLGWLVAGYVYWLLVRFSILPNSRGTIILVLLGIALATLFLARSAVLDGVAWLRENWRYCLLSEAVFLVAFAAMLLFRAYNPEISATEKPMEFAFLNASIVSPSFPPHDPWLSGQTISYYYFGYVLTALLVRLTGVAASVGFNLAIALLFGLAAQAIFGIIYGLVLAGRSKLTGLIDRGAAAAGAAGVFCLLVVGNLEGGLEFLHSRGWGSPEFWRAVAIDNLSKPYESQAWFPTDNWFWWRATRLINTFVDGRGQDYVISEFPYFSFLLGDLHPHVLALPFALLAIALACDQFRRRSVPAAPAEADGAAERPEAELPSNAAEPGTTPAAPAGSPWVGVRSVTRWVPARAVAAALIVGSLGFLNSWDFPTYFTLFVLAAAIGQYLARPKVDGVFAGAVARLALPTLILGIVFFLPFYLGFQTQASGIGVVGQFGAQFGHWLLYWGILLLPVAGLLAIGIGEAGRNRRPRAWAIAIAVAPAVVWMLAQWFVATPAAGPLGSWLPNKLLLLLPMVLLAVAAWWALDRRLAIETQAGFQASRPGSGGVAFALLVAALAATLILGAELFFIRDVFNTRMNTVFKLYYQAWILLAVAAGFGVYYTARALGMARLAIVRGPVRAGWAVAIAAVFAVALYYPAAAAANRSQGVGRGPTLDGLDFARRFEPNEVIAQEWLSRNVPADSVVLEAIGGQYSEFARVATRTGLQTVLGWPGHEAQWRGNDRLFRGREPDVDLIYRNADRAQTFALLQRYGVDYVYVGRLERAKYDPVALGQFDLFLPVAFQREGVTIYRVPA